MENIIKFDCANNLEKPTIVLALKSGKIIGNLNPIQNLYFEDIMTSPSNFSFSIDKTNCYYWDDINALEKILYDLDVMINDVKSHYRECGTFESGE